MCNFALVLSFKKPDGLDSMSRSERIAIVEQASENVFQEIVPNLNGMTVAYTKPIVGTMFLNGTKEQAELVQKYLKENNVGNIRCTDDLNLKLIQ